MAQLHAVFCWASASCALEPVPEAAVAGTGTGGGGCGALGVRFSAWAKLINAARVADDGGRTATTAACLAVFHAAVADGGDSGADGVTMVPAACSRQSSRMGVPSADQPQSATRDMAGR